MSNRNRDYQNFYGKRAPQIDAAPVETKPIEVTEPQVEETPVPEVPAEDNQPAESAVIKAVVTGAARVNVRAGNNKNTQVITVLPEGAEITLLDHIPDGWDKVMLKDGTEGYMMSKFLKRI